MALLATQPVLRAGLAPIFTAATVGGDTFTPGQTTFLHVKNASAGAITVTIVTPGTSSGLAIADVAVSVPATTGDRMIGPLPAFLFSLAGVGSITYTAVTSLTVAVISVDD